MISAAFDTIRTVGVARASARMIASVGGFDQSLIFYYFGSVNGLLVAALAESTERQLGRYRDALNTVEGPSDLMRVLGERLQDDLTSGHIAVMTAMVSAGAADRELALAINPLIEPWVTLAGETVQRLLAGIGLDGLISDAQSGFALVAMFLGVEMLVSLRGDEQPLFDLLRAGSKLASLVEAIAPTSKANGAES